MKRAAAFFGILLLGGPALAGGVAIRSESGAHFVTTDTYRADVEPDGCLTQIRAGETSFLAPGVGVSRGTYFYGRGPLRLPEVRKASSKAIAAVGDEAAIRYEFDEDSVELQLVNRTDAPLVFFLVFSREVVALKAGEGAIERAPATKGDGPVTFFTAAAKLTVTGGTRVWGPWSGGHTVCQVDLAAKEKRSVTLAVAAASEEEAAAVAAIAPAGARADPDLVLLSPLDWQVFQRHSKSSGTVLVSGRVRPECDSLEVRIGKEWQRVPVEPRTRSFHAELTVPAGGWYEAEAVARNGEEVVATALVPHVGVGEVFVGAGQSNSTNCGEEKLVPASGRVSTFDGATWREAADPQPGVHDRSAGGSFWPAFGDAMVERYGVPVGVAVTGHGGTSVVQWAPDGELYRWFLDRVRRLGIGGFRAALWHQGESDVKRPGDEYEKRLEEVIRTSKRDAGWEFPWFVAIATYRNPRAPEYPEIRAAQIRLHERGVALPGPDTDLLTGENRDRGGTGIHFSGKGLRAHGEAWATRVADWLDGVLGGN